jgi:hypothetical protein
MGAASVGVDGAPPTRRASRSSPVPAAAGGTRIHRWHVQPPHVAVRMACHQRSLLAVIGRVGEVRTPPTPLRTAVRWVQTARAASTAARPRPRSALSKASPRARCRGAILPQRGGAVVDIRTQTATPVAALQTQPRSRPRCTRVWSRASGTASRETTGLARRLRLAFAAVLPVPAWSRMVALLPRRRAPMAHPLPAPAQQQQQRPAAPLVPPRAEAAPSECVSRCGRGSARTVHHQRAWRPQMRAVMPSWRNWSEWHESRVGGWTSMAHLEFWIWTTASMVAPSAATGRNSFSIIGR